MTAAVTGREVPLVAPDTPAWRAAARVHNAIIDPPAPMTFITVAVGALALVIGGPAMNILLVGLGVAGTASLVYVHVVQRVLRALLHGGHPRWRP